MYVRTGRQIRAPRRGYFPQRSGTNSGVRKLEITGGFAVCLSCDWQPAGHNYDHEAWLHAQASEHIVISRNN